MSEYFHSRGLSGSAWVYVSLSISFPFQRDSDVLSFTQKITEKSRKNELKNENIKGGGKVNSVKKYMFLRIFFGDTCSVSLFS